LRKRRKRRMSDKKSFKEKYIMPILSVLAAIGGFLIYLFLKKPSKSEAEKTLEGRIKDTKGDIKDLGDQIGMVEEEIEDKEKDLQDELTRHEKEKKKLSVPIKEVIESNPDKAFAKLKERANAKKS